MLVLDLLALIWLSKLASRLPKGIDGRNRWHIIVLGNILFVRVAGICLLSFDLSVLGITQTPAKSGTTATLSVRPSLFEISV